MLQFLTGKIEGVSKGNWINLGITLLVLLLGIIFAGDFPKQDGHYGFWSLVPPLVAIVLAFWTQEVISALFVGVALGGVISGQLNIVQSFLIPSIGSEDFALILLVYLWSLGGLIGIWTRTGGAEKFALWASKKVVRDRRSAKFFTWLMGLIFHQGGTISTVLTGATVRPVADKHEVSHEELSYMVDSTASPAATVIPFNVWPIYVGGLVAGTIPMFETAEDGISFFLQALPFNFYGIFALLITLLFAWELLPWIPGKKMRNAIARARETGELDHEDAEPLAASELTETDIPDDYNPGLVDFFGPLGTLLGVAIIPYVITFYILGQEDPLLMISEAFVLAVLAGMLIALVKGMKLKTVIDGFVDGCKGVTIGAIILALAVSLKSVADAVGTADYVVAITGGSLAPATLPALLLLLCMIIAFSTGTSWGTYAVVFPVAIPLAWAVLPDTFFLTICFGAVIGGSVFGDQCSPISDTTILSSLATGCDLMDHVYTQIPLALTAAGIAAFLYTMLVIFFV
ncbi:sodium:proton antiporter [Aliifodinibius sp. S!AR15-10]|uniref:Na+/H+ antiporter NhaC family protein n=1 Tax=Aliifodinibius sp. S!AR15-10 TaxID=2950437 RepID=UPI00285C47D9|nr:Na+/H+ antiporter NhaC family protein [Aliifodinibius sp. S!AR15-10]MDR8391999.1 sodium:proton antiporter [Aliifodinibius sp. S!AR15-10]